jgi:hypothetical protein
MVLAELTRAQAKQPEAAVGPRRHSDTARC